MSLVVPMCGMMFPNPNSIILGIFGVLFLLFANTLGELVLKRSPKNWGGNYNGQYAKDIEATITTVDGAAGHPILAGVLVPFKSTAALYGASPLAESAKALLVGAIPGQKPEERWGFSEA